MCDPKASFAAAQLDLAEHFDTTPEMVGRPKQRKRRADVAVSAASSSSVAGAAARAWGGESSSAAAGTAPSGASSGAGVSKKAKATLERARAAKYSELEQRESRLLKMKRTLERIGIERALQGKGKVKKLKTKSGELRQYKWRQERKR